MGTKTLYEIGADFRTLYDLVMDDESENYQAEVVQQLNEFFEQTTKEAGEKIDAYVKVLRSIQSLADQTKLEADRIHALAKSRDAKIELLKGRLHDFMKEHMPRYDGAFAKVWIQNNSTTPVNYETWVIESPAEIPEEFRRTTFEVNATAVRARLAQMKIAEDEARATNADLLLTLGEQADFVKPDYEKHGIEPIVFANYGERGTHIRIK